MIYLKDYPAILIGKSQRPPSKKDGFSKFLLVKFRNGSWAPLKVQSSTPTESVLLGYSPRYVRQPLKGVDLLKPIPFFKSKSRVWLENGHLKFKEYI